MPATWIFQATPNRFDLDGFFDTKPITVAFLVTHYAERMAAGDKVYIWRAVGGGDETTSGVIAEAEMGSPVSERLDDAASRPFWKDQTKALSRLLVSSYDSSAPPRKRKPFNVDG